jgi:hypothetical protein
MSQTLTILNIYQPLSTILYGEDISIMLGKYKEGKPSYPLNDALLTGYNTLIIESQINEYMPKDDYVLSIEHITLISPQALLHNTNIVKSRDEIKYFLNLEKRDVKFKDLSVSIKDPYLELKIQKYPGRGINCTHIRVFSII